MHANSMEDELQWKTTFNGDNLPCKMTFNGRRTSKNMIWKIEENQEENSSVALLSPACSLVYCSHNDGFYSLGYFLYTDPSQLDFQ